MAAASDSFPASSTGAGEAAGGEVSTTALKLCESDGRHNIGQATDQGLDSRRNGLKIKLQGWKVLKAGSCWGRTGVQDG